MKKSLYLTLVALMLVGASFAQITNPATATTPITATKAESLTISASTIPAFAIAAGAATSTANQDLTITTTWNLKPSRTAVAVCAGVTSAGLIASDPSNTDSIAASSVLASTGSTFAAINAGAGCAAPGSVTSVSSTTLSGANRKAGSKVDTLHLQLSGLATTLQADTYTGTITVYANVTP